MTTPAAPDWSGAVQRELDGMQRNVDSRLVEFSTRLDKLLTLTEYHADQRAITIQLANASEKTQDNEKDIESLKRELRDSYELLRREMAAERSHFETALNEEIKNRQNDLKEFIKTRQAQFRWLISMVMIPLAIAIVELLTAKK